MADADDPMELQQDSHIHCGFSSIEVMGHDAAIHDGIKMATEQNKKMDCTKLRSVCDATVSSLGWKR